MSNRKFVRLLYSLLLGRDPENHHVVAAKANSFRANEILKTFLDSEEFLVKNSKFTRPLIEVHTSDLKLSKLIEKTRFVWESLSESEPYYAVLTDNRFLPEFFGSNTNAFWSSGEDQIKDLFILLERLIPNFPRPRMAVELGSGVGRLSIPLSAHVENLIAFDVSPSMVQICMKNTSSRVNVEVREISQVKDFCNVGGIDLFVSLITLQHNVPPVQFELLVEVFRNLAIGGVAVFQVVVFRAGYSFSVDEYLSKPSKGMEMHPLPIEFVFELCRKNSVYVLDIFQDDLAGREHLSHTFLVQKFA